MVLNLKNIYDILFIDFEIFSVMKGLRSETTAQAALPVRPNSTEASRATKGSNDCEDAAPV
jgi:hypothetical protein